jgi:MYXO-CTERM domain-containing protein
MCFNDADSDGFGGTVPIESPDLLCNGGGLALLNDDCNDIPLQGEGINPGADEVAADGVDQNCDGAEDCYQDLDRDRYGSQSIATSTALDCFADGVAANSDDCYDISPGGELINPGATEQPGSGIDENCDGLESCFQDVDADGYGNGTIQESPTIDCSEVGVSRTSDDCNDALPEINPGAIELPADLVDQNCDREEDCYRDEDADDFGSTVIVSSPILTCDGVNVADNDEDCNDTLPAGAFIFPGATEVPGNGIDEDCDGGESCYIDADGDGFGGLNTTVTTAFDCNAPDATTVGGDCDDSNVGINPDADEVPVNGIDEDCDGGDLCYRDIDGDGFGSTEFIASADLFCTGTGEATNNTDCLDVGTVGIVAAAEIYPGAPEMCNEVDDDCDTLIDDDDTNLVDGFTWYLDADGDDFGQTGITTLACSQPSGYASDDGDCNDGNAGINPDAQEVCDPADNDEDCDGEADENDVNLFGGVDAIGAFVAYPDLDGDLYGDSDPTRAVFVCELSPGLVEDNTDCYDLPPGGIQVNPGLDEIPYDGFDNDCDPATPDDDLDGDGFGHNDDCNDVPGSGFSVNPSSSEGLFADGIDNDCNGFVDDGTSAFDDDGDGWTEDGGDCDDTDPEVHPGAVERANQRDDDCDNVNDDGTDLYDDDGDGFTEAEGDCNDAVGAVNPGATEIMDDGVDNDCDGAVDAGSYDPDGDGYTEGGGDCNPENGNVFPEAPELADGLDNDCDGTIDEGTFAYDDDGDGYTEQTGDCNDVPGAGELVNPGQREVANGIDDNCDGTIDEGSDNADDDSDGYAENQGDCDDTNPQRYPGADEIDNGIDDDCDGAVDEDASDLDGDGFTVAAGDCDDSNGWANPEETEVCDGIDNDCDGATDNIPGCTDVDDTGLPQPKPPGCNCNGTGTGTQSLPFFALLLAGLRRRQRSRK